MTTRRQHKAYAFSATLVIHALLCVVTVPVSAQTANIVLRLQYNSRDEPKTDPPYIPARILANLYMGVSASFTKSVDQATVANYVSLLQTRPYAEYATSCGVTYGSKDLAQYLTECIRQSTFQPTGTFSHAKLDAPWDTFWQNRVSIVGSNVLANTRILEYRPSGWSEGKYGRGDNPDGAFSVTFASAELVYIKRGKPLWRRTFPSGSPRSVSTASPVVEIPLSLQQFLWNDFHPATAESIQSGVANEAR